MGTPAEKRVVLNNAKEKMVTMGYIYAGKSSPSGLPGFKEYELRIDNDAKTINQDHPSLFWVWDMKLLRKMPRAKTKEQEEEIAKKCRKRFSLERIAWMIVDGILYDYRKDPTKVPTTVGDLDNSPGGVKITSADDAIAPGTILSKPKPVEQKPEEVKAPEVEQKPEKPKKDPFKALISRRAARLSDLGMSKTANRERPKKRLALILSVAEQECDKHSFHWTGSMPGTGSQRCYLCGYRKDELDEGGYLK